MNCECSHSSKCWATALVVVLSGMLEKAFMKTAINFTYIRFIAARACDLINKITAGEIRNFIFVGNEI